MRWKIKVKPTHAQRRIKKRFALLPKACNDGMIVWFENYWVCEYYHISRLIKWRKYNTYSSTISIPMEEHDYYSIEL